MTSTNLEFGKNAVDTFKNGRSKIERYGWKPTAGMGEFRLIHKSKLVVDRKYQRDLNESLVRSIASEFSWPAFSTIVVAERDDGGLFVVTGQTRVAASMRRSDIGDLPCMVFRFSELTEEAKAFLVEGKHRRSVGAHDSFRAEVITGDRSAVTAKELMDAHGRQSKPTDGGDSLRCIGQLKRLVKADEKVLRQIFPLVNRICINVAIDQMTLGAIFYIERLMQQAGLSLTEKRWVDRILSIPHVDLLGEARRTASLYRRGGDKQWAIGFVNAINYKLKHKLPVEFPTNE